MAARTFRKKKNNDKVVSFSELFFMFTLTWTTQKELENRGLEVVEWMDGLIPLF